jgi:hypothetical protein
MSRSPFDLETVARCPIARSGPETTPGQAGTASCDAQSHGHITPRGAGRGRGRGDSERPSRPAAERRRSGGGLSLSLGWPGRHAVGPGADAREPRSRLTAAAPRHWHCRGPPRARRPVPRHARSRSLELTRSRCSDRDRDCRRDSPSRTRRGVTVTCGCSALAGHSARPGAQGAALKFDSERLESGPSNDTIIVRPGRY